MDGFTTTLVRRFAKRTDFDALEESRTRAASSARARHETGSSGPQPHRHDAPHQHGAAGETDVYLYRSLAIVERLRRAVEARP